MSEEKSEGEEVASLKYRGATQWLGVGFSNENKVPENFEKFMKIKVKEQENLKSIRGRILFDAISIENNLERFISQYFISDDTKRGIFNVEVLLKPEFSFFFKWNVVRGIFKTDPNYKNMKNRKLLVTEIKKIIETRNRFAHCDIVFNDGDIVLHYFSNGLKETKITQDFFDKISDSIKFVESEIDNLTQALFKNNTNKQNSR